VADFLAGVSAVLIVITGYMTVATFGFGAVLAMIISWNRNFSVLWAILHGWFGWLYVFYYCIQRKPGSR
jgi:hypothetical protein